MKRALICSGMASGLLRPGGSLSALFYVLPCARSVGFASWLTIVREVAGRGCAGFRVQSQILRFQRCFVFFCLRFGTIGISWIVILGR